MAVLRQTDYFYDNEGKPYKLVVDNGSAAHVGYYVLNQQGDVIAILDETGGVVVTYEYNAWGKILDETGSGTLVSIYLQSYNHLKYRGYYHDTETGFYYLNSRYYDPVVGRFINADGYVSTGQGFIGYNMYAYCGNSPINRIDSLGQFFVPALIAGGLILAGAMLLSGCSTKAEPYQSADDAAKAFSEQVYDSSSYIRHEYSTEIYSRTINGETTYNYNSPRAGQPHTASVGNSTPKGTKTVAYAHTHPNSNSFSEADIRAARNLGIDAYVVGPSLELQRYNVSSATTTSLGLIVPIALTDTQRDSLVTEFQISWDAHVADGCNFGCNSMIWPRHRKDLK